MAAKTNKKVKGVVSKKAKSTNKAPVKEVKKTKVKPSVQTLEEAVTSKFKMGPIRNIMTKAGMVRVNEQAFNTVRMHMQRYLASILSEAYGFTTADKRTTISSGDMDKVVAARNYDKTVEEVAKMLDDAKGNDNKLLFIARANSSFICRKITEEVGFSDNEKKPRFGNDVISCAQYYLEREVNRLIESVLLVTEHNNRKTVKAADIELVLDIEKRCPHF